MFPDNSVAMFLNSSVVPFHGIFEKVCDSKPFGNSYGSPRLQNRSAQMFLGNNVEMCLDQFPDRGVTMFQSNNADMFQNSPA